MQVSKWDPNGIGGTSLPLISASAATSFLFSISTKGTGFLGSRVEVFESTFGHDGAFVSAPSSSRSSLTCVPLFFAAGVRLHKVTEKPGPLSDVSKVAEYIFTGLMFQFVSVRSLVIIFR